jgi:hypothetical protein
MVLLLFLMKKTTFEPDKLALKKKIFLIFVTEFLKNGEKILQTMQIIFWQ